MGQTWHYIPLSTAVGGKFTKRFSMVSRALLRVCPQLRMCDTVELSQLSSGATDEADSSSVHRAVRVCTACCACWSACRGQLGASSGWMAVSRSNSARADGRFSGTESMHSSMSSCTASGSSSGTLQQALLSNGAKARAADSNTQHVRRPAQPAGQQGGKQSRLPGVHRQPQEWHD